MTVALLHGGYYDKMDTYQVISLIVSALSVLGFGTLMKILIQERHEKRKADTAEAKAKIKRERQEEMREVVSEEIKSIKDEIARLHTTDEIQRQGIQAILRDRLYQLNRYCTTRKGYTTIDDRENFENMYQRYHSLGVNGVMDKTRAKFFELPTEEEYFANNKTNTK